MQINLLIDCTTSSRVDWILDARVSNGGRRIKSTSFTSEKLYFPARNRVYRYRPADLIAQEQAVLRFIPEGILRSSVIPLQTGNPRRFSRCNGERFLGHRRTFSNSHLFTCACVLRSAISVAKIRVSKAKICTRKRNDGLLISAIERY